MCNVVLVERCSIRSVSNEESTQGCNTNLHKKRMLLYFQTFVQCRFYHAFQKFLITLCLIDVLTTLILMKSLIISNLTLERVQFSKFLGVLIDEYLTWKQHIDCVSKTISRNIGVMNKLKYSIQRHILHTLYCTLITPHLNYGKLIWGSTCKSCLDKLIKLQKWAIRTITNSHYRSHNLPKIIY